MEPDQLPDHLLRVAEHVGAGHSYRETASRLDLSVHTVRHYVRDVSARLPTDSYGDMPPKTAVLVWWNNQENPTAP